MKKSNRSESILGYRFSRLHRLQLALCRDDIQNAGLLPSQCPLIVKLVHEKDQVTQDQLSKLVMLDKGTTARTVRELERNGFLRRRPNPENRRQNLLSATPKAHVAAQHIHDSLSRAADVFLKDFAPEDRNLVRELIDRMIENAERALCEQ